MNEGPPIPQPPISLPVPDENGLIHATTVAIKDHAVLIMGQSGSGKSDLALRLIDRGARLVSDDYTIITPDAQGGLIAEAPSSITGQMEVRGVGIITMEYLDKAPVALAVALLPADARPDRSPLHPALYTAANIDIPLIMLNPFEGSAVIKLELSVNQAIMGRSFYKGRVCDER